MPREEPAFKLKNANLPLFVLHIVTDDPELLRVQLEKRVRQNPGLLSDAPVVIGLSGHAESGRTVDFSTLIGLLREQGMCPAGALGGTPEQRAAAVAAGLGLFPDTPPRPAPRAGTAPAADAPDDGQSPGAPAAPTDHTPPPVLDGLPGDGAEPSIPPASRADPVEPTGIAEPARTSLIIDKPVRTGQRIYAEGADLVVLAVVNPGAELIADGDIHVYAPLRGRALAGARGNRSARIFAQCMEAELVTIAGYFQVFENGIPDEARGKPAQAYLDGERMVLKPLAPMRA